MRITRAAVLLLASLLALAVSCRSTPRGATEHFARHAPHAVFVLAPPLGPLSGEQAEVVRRALVEELRAKGYAISSAVDARLVPSVSAWGANVTLSARVVDGEQRLLWEDQVSVESRAATDRDRAARAVRKLLQSLPAAADPPRR